MFTSSLQRNVLSFTFLIVIFSFLLAPLSFSQEVYAQNTSSSPGGGSGSQVSSSPGGGNQAGPSTSTNGAVRLVNPLKGGNGEINDIPTLVQKLLSIVLKIGVPLIALAIIYTGYLFIAAQGKPDKLKEAKDTLLFVLIGAGILLGAYVIAQAVYNTIEAIRGA